MSDPESSSQRGTSGRRWWQHVWVWFAGLVAAIISAIVPAWITGLLEPDPPAPPRLTNVRYIVPFSGDGKLQSPYRAARKLKAGECPSHSFQSSDPEALRCFAEGNVLDPCWTHALTAVCLGSPWDHNATVIEQATNTAGPPDQSHRTVPWALEIRDPVSGATLQCAALPGAQRTVAGQRMNWGCDNEHGKPAGNGVGSPTRSDEKPWTVLYNAEGATDVRRADVLTVWN
ncbi:hypothetical protein OHA27_38130 [Streptomyces sp. NBC_01619]|uniref:hypothetical protein n=1 Tax=Streptomyces sp. NBC_01619 TaxID=2975901 RepID=UPI00225A73F6|nr:hypothetical protein [Streptomyces sp. NBC_01619]MCX4515939.1 hypothetical protein [Streptomyces sp. NBC_01619]